VHAGWHSIFWFPTGVGVLLWVANARLLPETLHADHRQSFHIRHLMQGYWQLGSSPRFLLLALASGVPFNGMFLYVLAAPAFLGTHTALRPRSSSGSLCITRHHGRGLAQRAPGRAHYASDRFAWALW
jgi:DHA1 family bicyclomycin/chloramphenicol resistance-like MFS transporter